MDFDDEPRKTGPAITVGAELGDLSVDELAERIVALKAEISRIETEIANKKLTKTDADSIFKI